MTREELLDDIGWKLLRELQGNGRISYRSLSRKVKLTSSQVAKRMEWMTAAGIITGYIAEVDPKTFGLPVTAFIRMSVTGNNFGRVTRLVRQSPEVFECHRGTAADSFIMKVHLRDVEQLERIVGRFTPFGRVVATVMTSAPVKRRKLTRELLKSLLGERACPSTRKRNK